MPCMEQAGEVENLFKWGKKRGVGGKKKEVQFYESFSYDGEEYALYDCVYMHNESEPKPFIGKLVKIWETADKTRKVKVQWFFRPLEISNWLRDVMTLENEIFLAHGQGVGLANVNPLEAIAGKCNVVCISEDERNPQPSEVELEVADYVFSRTFDVDLCIVLDKMGDRVGGIEIKYIFNRKKSETVNGVPKLESGGKDQVLLLPEQNPPPSEFKIVEADGNYNHLVADIDAGVREADLLSPGNAKELMLTLVSSPGGNIDKQSNSKPGAAVNLSEVDTKNVEKRSIPVSETIKCKVDSDKDEVIQVGVERMSKSAKNADSLDNRLSPKAKVDSCTRMSEENNVNSSQTFSHHGDDAKALVTATAASAETAEFGNGNDGTDVENADETAHSEGRPSKRARVVSSGQLSEDKSKIIAPKLSINSDENNVRELVASVKKPSGERTKARFATDFGSGKESRKQEKPSEKRKTSEMSKNNVEADSLSGETTAKCKVDSGKDEIMVGKAVKTLKSSKDADASDNRLFKKAKVDNFAKVSEENSSNSRQKFPFPGNGGKDVVIAAASFGEKSKSGQGNDSYGLDNGGTKVKGTVVSEGRPSNKSRVSSSAKQSVNKNKNDSPKLSIDSDGNKNSAPKGVAASLKPSGDGTKSRLAIDSLGLPKKSPKQEKPDEKLRNVSSGRLCKDSAAEFAHVDREPEGQGFEITRRPDADKSKWFRALPWEERMQDANEQGKLLLLYNLDPDYTSAEVEDIIWHAFKENCSAKMVQRTKISSPHSGQAFIILKTREAAERVIRKLDEDCLMLSNGRPLVGSTVPPCSPGKQSTFVGHLIIDKARLQMQREMKDAVSTSHCSQPNTIEYEMAMEWCLLQSRSDSWWKRLFKQHADDLKKLEANLKPT